MEQKYHLDYRRFSLIYLLYPPVFGIVFYESGVPFADQIQVMLAWMIIAVVATHFFFKKVIYDKAVIVAADDGAYSYNLLGDKEFIAYKDMAEPRIDRIFLTKRIIIDSKENELIKLVITDFTEKSDELLAKIKEKMAEQKPANA